MSKHPVITFLCLLMLTGLVYLRALSADFVYEDLLWLPLTDFHSAWGAHWSLYSGRGLFTTPLDQLLGQGDPGIYHRTSLIIHLLTGTAVYVLLLRLFRVTWSAFLGAVIFLLHPLHSEAVLYISQRPDMLQGLFVVLGVIALLSPRWWIQVWAIPCYWFAVHSAEMGATGIGILILILLWQYSFKAIPRWTAVVVVASIWPLYHLLFDWFIPEIGFESRGYSSPFGAVDYFALQATSVWGYVSMFLLPVGFTVDHDFEIVPQLLQYGAGLLLLITTGTLMILFVHRTWNTPRNPRALWVLGLLWVLVSLAPRLVVRIPEVINEHQLYQAMVGAVLTAAFFIMTIFNKDKEYSL